MRPLLPPMGCPPHPCGNAHRVSSPINQRDVFALSRIMDVGETAGRAGPIVTSSSASDRAMPRAWPSPGSPHSLYDAGGPVARRWAALAGARRLVATLSRRYACAVSLFRSDLGRAPHSLRSPVHETLVKGHPAWLCLADWWRRCCSNCCTRRRTARGSLIANFARCAGSTT